MYLNRAMLFSWLSTEPHCSSFCTWFHLCLRVSPSIFICSSLRVSSSLWEGGPVDEMGMMLNNIKEGGVSLIGHEQPFTYDHFRKSFIRRNKNPIINEKAHTLRALQSTLKVSGSGYTPPGRSITHRHSRPGSFSIGLWMEHSEMSQCLLDILAQHGSAWAVVPKLRPASTLPETYSDLFIF